ncbi:MAG TPA: non-homologous end-joining DNA ligase [Blastocatellia bacterium]|nr:non-homologous end-joining DNA ligase [Blastocatellia bacterium]
MNPKPKTNRPATLNKDRSQRSTGSDDPSPTKAKATRRKRPSGRERTISLGANSSSAVAAAAFLHSPDAIKDVTIKLPGGAVEITNLDKVFWPENGYLKADLLRYYLEVADVIIKYLKDRPAILARYPNGMADQGFFQQNIKDAPGILKTVRLENQVGRFLNYAVYTSVASLIYLVNLGTIAQNPWHSRLSNLDRPDYVVLDLDPHGAPFHHVLKVALVIRDVLGELGLTGYPKSSGSSGIHVYVPLNRRYEYEEVARFAEQVATKVARRSPDIATVERRISARKPGQVYVDPQQNARGKSAASVYSVRAKPGATVSAPVTWAEVSDGFEIADFTIATVPKRIKEKGDIWAAMLKDRQTLPKLTGQR